jgi:DNA-binding CsgD family transcriptional regulator
MFEAAAGLGKSQLLAEAIRRGRDRGLRILHARATQSERDFTFAVVLRLFEPYLSSLAAEERETLLGGSAGLARQLLAGEVQSDSSAIPLSLFALLHGLYWLTANIAERGPLLICVDDLQWCDEESLRFLLYVAGRVDGLAIALLTAGRPHRQSPESDVLGAVRSAPAFTPTRLGPLSADGVAELVRRRAPGATDDFCDACAEVTGGNPFYLHELLLALAADGDERFRAEPARIRELGNRSVARAALFRLAGLGDAAARFAEAMAVLGDQAPLQRVAALADVPVEEAADLADELAAEELITAGPTLSFAHPLINESIYDQMRPAKRALLHATAASLLRDSSVPIEQLAAQLIRSPAAAAEWAVDALRRAARQAVSHGAPGTAARYLQRALAEDCSPELGDEVLLELGAAETAAGLAGASQRIASVLNRQVDPIQRADVQRRLARALGSEGQPEAAAEAFETAIDELPDVATDLHVGLLADYLTNAAFQPGLRQRAFARAEPALRHPPDASTPQDRVLLSALAMRSGQIGRRNADTISLAMRAWADGALLDPDGPDGSGWLMAVWALTLAEDYDSAIHLTEAAEAAATAIGSVGAFAAASYFHGYACLRVGRLNEAQADAEQAISAAGAEWHRYRVPGLVLRSNVLIERGMLDDAADTLAQAADRADTGMFGVPWTLHAQGLLASASHRPGEALELFERAGAYLVGQLDAEHTVLPWRADAAWAAVQLGDLGRARALVDAELAATQTTDAVIGQSRALRILGLIEGGERGLDLLTDAAARLQDSQAALERGYALTDLGAALRRAGRRAESRQPLDTALEITGRLGADLLDARIRDELAASGARPRATTRTGVASLTPSERRVAGFAAKHLSNKQIAQALFVTPKTVEYHLRHAYQKLGISSRAELLGVLDDTDPRDAP